MNRIAHVFDFDDTLSHSDSMIHVHPFYNGEPTEIHRMPGLQGVRHTKLEYLPKSLKYSFTSRDFAFLSHAIDSNSSLRSIHHGQDVGHGHVVSLDFSDIIGVDQKNARPIKKNFLQLEKAAKAGCDLWILTGRKSGGENEISHFVKSHSGILIPQEKIICVGGWEGQTHTKKALAFLTKILPHQYKEIHFYDDDQRNLDEVKTQLSPFASVHLINSYTDEISSDAKDRVQRAKEKRLSDFSRIRKLSGII
jgi:hypothetical protein